MNHAITAGEIVGIIGAMTGLFLAAVGADAMFGRKSGSPEEAAQSEESGCGLLTVGIVVLVVTLMLSACAGHPAVPADRIVVEKVPVAIMPIKPSDIPATPPPLGPRPPTAQQAADAAFAAHCRDVAFIIRAVPLLLLSAGLPPVQAPDFPECAKH
jgi:hypothetical protein